MRSIAHEAAAQIPDPLPAAEVEGIAQNVYEYLWRNKGFTKPHNQARRGRRSGKAKRNATAERDASIRARHNLGYSQAAISVQMNVHQTTVGRVLRREHQTRMES